LLPDKLEYNFSNYVSAPRIAAWLAAVSIISVEEKAVDPRICNDNAFLFVSMCCVWLARSRLAGGAVWADYFGKLTTH